DTRIRAAGDINADPDREGDYAVANVCEAASLKLNAVRIHPVNTDIIEGRNDYAGGSCDSDAGNAVVNRRVLDVNFFQALGQGHVNSKAVPGKKSKDLAILNIQRLT